MPPQGGASARPRRRCTVLLAVIRLTGPDVQGARRVSLTYPHIWDLLITITAAMHEKLDVHCPAVGRLQRADKPLYESPVRQPDV